MSTDDSHNVISLGISPTDGRLHVAMDTHNTTVFYVKSEAGLVTTPASRTWSAARFGAVQRTLDGVELGGISYPQFVVTPERRLQFSYRTGGSGNGTNELAEYDGVSWRRLGIWSSATGSWTAPNGVNQHHPQHVPARADLRPRWPAARGVHLARGQYGRAVPPGVV